VRLDAPTNGFHLCLLFDFCGNIPPCRTTFIEQARVTDEGDRR
jgi:hypothetical protein